MIVFLSLCTFLLFNFVYSLLLACQSSPFPLPLFLVFVSLSSLVYSLLYLSLALHLSLYPFFLSRPVQTCRCLGFSLSLSLSLSLSSLQIYTLFIRQMWPTEFCPAQFSSRVSTTAQSVLGPKRKLSQIRMA